MPDLSASIVALVGAIMIGIGFVPSSTAEAARGRVIRFGSLVVSIGLICWLLAFTRTMGFALVE